MICCHSPFKKKLSLVTMNNNNLQAILWIIACSFFSVVNVALIHYIGTILPISLMLFTRNFLSLFILIPLLYYYRIKINVNLQYKMHLVRGLMGVLAMYTWFAGAALIPITDSVAINFSMPLFSCLAAFIFLNEKVGIRRIFALVIGFFAIIYILKPGTQMFQIGGLIVLLASIIMAINSIIVKKLTAKDPALLIVFYFTITSSVFSLPFAVYNFVMPDAKQFITLVFIALTGLMQQICLTKALSKAPVSLLTSFDFIRIVFASLIGYLFLGQVIKIDTLIGSAIIVSSSVYIAYRESKSKGG